MRRICADTCKSPSGDASCPASHLSEARLCLADSPLICDLGLCAIVTSDMPRYACVLLWPMVNLSWLRIPAYLVMEPVSRPSGERDGRPFSVVRIHAHIYT